MSVYWASRSNFRAAEYSDISGSPLSRLEIFDVRFWHDKDDLCIEYQKILDAVVPNINKALELMRSFAVEWNEVNSACELAEEFTDEYMKRRLSYSVQVG